MYMTRVYILQMQCFSYKEAWYSFFVYNYDKQCMVSVWRLFIPNQIQLGFFSWLYQINMHEENTKVLWNNLARFILNNDICSVPISSLKRIKD